MAAPVLLDRGVLEQFMAVTGVDEEMAKYYLTENNNSLERAIDMYYANQSVVVIDDDSDVDVTLPAQVSQQGEGDNSVIVVDDSDEATPRESVAQSEPEPDPPQPAAESLSQGPEEIPMTLKLICWNIQGLEERLLWDRTMAAITILQRESPDVVFLQEVIADTQNLLEQHLRLKYHIFPGGRREYFASMLLKKEAFQMETALVEPFPRSRMGRNLIIAKAKFHGVPMKLMTSHIESLKTSSRERQSQLRTTFNHMRDISPSAISIFGADTNAKDAEISSLQTSGDMTDIQDVWETLGSSNETKYTWDMSQNDNLPIRGPRIRYDRLYYHQSGERISPAQLELIGRERLGCGMFISDHWGMMARFNLRTGDPHTPSGT